MTHSETRLCEAAPSNVYLSDRVAKCLADRGLPGSVQIRPHKPLAARLESGERASFVVDYEGVGTAHLIVDEYQIACGTVGASVVTSLADMIEKQRRLGREAA
jgi:hypothetical protein